MANIKFNRSTSDVVLPWYYIEDSDVDLKNKSSSRVTIETDDGEELVVRGENLSYSQNKIVGGTVSSVEFYNEDGKLIAKAKKLDFDAQDFYDKIGDKDLSVAVQKFVFGDHDDITGTGGDDFLFGYDGRDHLFGKGGRDELGGGSGADILNGGNGKDTFQAGAKGSGNDTIEDFDFKGGNHDFLKVFDEFKAVARGDDVLLKFDNGSTTLLLDMTLKEFDKVDLIWV